MKKLLLASCLFVLGGSQMMMAQKSKGPATVTKATMLKKLGTDMSKGMIADGTSKEKADKFANCFTKDLEAKLSLEQLTVFYKLNNVKPGQAPPKDLITKAEKMGLPAKMQTVGMDCGAILQ